MLGLTLCVIGNEEKEVEFIYEGRGCQAPYAGKSVHPCLADRDAILYLFCLRNSCICLMCFIERSGEGTNIKKQLMDLGGM